MDPEDFDALDEEAEAQQSSESLVDNEVEEAEEKGVESTVHEEDVDEEAAPEEEEEEEETAPQTAEQPSFQPNVTTPINDGRQILCWNHHGRVLWIPNENILEIERLSDNRRIKSVNHRCYTLASVSESGVSFAGGRVEPTLPEHPPNGYGSSVSFRPYQIFGTTTEWVYDFYEPETPTCLAIGKNFVACVTNLQIIYIFSIFGSPIERFEYDESVVSVSAMSDCLLIVFHNGSPRFQQVYEDDEPTVINKQSLKYEFWNLSTHSDLRLMSSGPVTVSPGRSLRWIGISDELMPCTLDSAGIFRGLLPAGFLGGGICVSTMSSQMGRDDAGLGYSLARAHWGWRTFQILDQVKKRAHEWLWVIGARRMSVEVVPVLVSDEELIEEGQKKIMAEDSSLIGQIYSHHCKPAPDPMVLYSSKLASFAIPLPGSYLLHRFDDKNNLLKPEAPPDKDVMELHEQYIRTKCFLSFWSEAFRIGLPSISLVNELDDISTWKDPDKSTKFIEWIHNKKILLEKSVLIPLMRKYIDIGQEERAMDIVKLITSVELLQVMAKWSTNKGLTRLATKIQDSIALQQTREESFVKSKSDYSQSQGFSQSQEYSQSFTQSQSDMKRKATDSEDNTTGKKFIKSAAGGGRLAKQLAAS
eukprot:GHVL01026897.1.p1 GENE.GHVL01026897.1~~GHVL01026897.1.p1  ORF type:complete len:643 (-),score=133.89 GHVL01026897.1:310-2238(-)